MGLTFWSDRTFQINESNDGLYHCALPLTNITSITEDMISTAFQGISKMYGGGDAEEDVLLGQLKKLFHLFLRYSRHRFLKNRSSCWLA